MAEKQSTTKKTPKAPTKAAAAKKKAPAAKTKAAQPKKPVAKAAANKPAAKKVTAETAAASPMADGAKGEKPAQATTVAKKAKVAKPITMGSLYNWNKWLALIHLLQGALILVLSTTKVFPVFVNFLSVDTLASVSGQMPVLVPAVRQVGDLNLAYLIAAFFFMSAIAHALIATVYRKRYEADLAVGINKARWIEYSLSASTMMVAIGALVGVVSFSSLLMLFALTAVMNLLGLIMEVSNQGHTKVSWLSYNVGCIAGIVPWIVIAQYLLSGYMYGSKAPTFVYFIFVSMFVLFMSFAVNMFLQYRGKGKWANYLYGERAYMILSLVAKTALAWQVFAGTLRP